MRLRYSKLRAARPSRCPTYPDAPQPRFRPAAGQPGIAWWHPRPSPRTALLRTDQWTSRAPAHRPAECPRFDCPARRPHSDCPARWPDWDFLVQPPDYPALPGEIARQGRRVHAQRLAPGRRSARPDLTRPSERLVPQRLPCPGRGVRPSRYWAVHRPAAVRTGSWRIRACPPDRNLRSRLRHRLGSNHRLRHRNSPDRSYRGLRCRHCLRHSGFRGRTLPDRHQSCRSLRVRPGRRWAGCRRWGSLRWRRWGRPRGLSAWPRWIRRGCRVVRRGSSGRPWSRPCRWGARQWRRRSCRGPGLRRAGPTRPGWRGWRWCPVRRPRPGLPCGQSPAAAGRLSARTRATPRFG